MSAWANWDNRRRIFAIAVAAVVVSSVAYAYMLKTLVLGAHATTAIDDLGEAVAAAVASAACVWAATRALGRDRLGWTLMGISTGLWAAGEVAWSVYEVFLQVPVPSPGLPDAGFLSAVPFAVAGLRAFWGEARGTSSRWRVWFDGLIVTIALTSTAWGFGLNLVLGADENLTTKVFSLAYPVGDILIGTVLILAIRRASSQQKGRMALLLCGVAAYSIADSAFAYLTAQNAYGAVGSVLNTGWFAGFLLIGLAALYPEGSRQTAVKQTPLDLWQLALPWMTLLTAAAGDFYTAVTHHDTGLFQPAMTVALAVLLTFNMILERREFLEMLTEIQSSHSKLNREFKAALVEVRRFSKAIRDAERHDADEVRRLAAEIHGIADRLEVMIEEILDTEVEGADIEVAEVPATTAGLVAAGRSY
jgi:hypothetical protein